MTGARWPSGARPDEDLRRVRQDVQAELDAHFDGTVELLVRRGWRKEDALAEARRRFGDIDRYRIQLERIGRRGLMRARVRAARELLGGSFRSAIRSLARSPGFSAAVVVTLTLGIGANAAIFRVVDRLLLSPPEHVERPSEVRRLFQTIAGEDGDLDVLDAFTYPDVHALRRAGLPARVGAFVVLLPETLGEGEGAIRVRVARADSALLPLLGVAPAVGRGFLPEDHLPGARPVMLLGYTLWETRFAADPSVLGSTVRVGPGSYEVIGVLPRGFIGAMPPSVEAWLPLESSAEAVWGAGWSVDQSLVAFSILARVREPLRERLAQESTGILARSRTEYGLRGELRGISTASLVPGDGPDNVFGATVPVSRWLAGVSLLVLVVACANVANLFLAQGERSRRETAVRMALGAGRLRVRMELLSRALVLALLGAAGAFALAAWAGETLEELVFGAVEFTSRARTSRLLVFTGGAALFAATLSGLLPALRAPQALAATVADGGIRTTSGSRGTRRTLVAVQTALSTILLVGAALFVLSFRAAVEKDLGFDVERLVMVRLEREQDAGPAAATLVEEAERRLRMLPSVASVARTVAVPFVRLYGLQARIPAGEARSGPAVEPFSANAVGSDFFDTMGIPLLSGRGIEASDLAPGAEPVAVVGQRAAARLWPGEEPIGRCLEVGAGERRVPCARVVGVAAEHVQRELIEEIGMMAWVPLTLSPVRSTPTLMVRVEGDPAELVTTFRREALAIPSVRYVEVTPLSELANRRNRQMRSWRLGATVFSLFGVIAIGVAGVGLYALLACDVVQRRREIGIRIALGASGRSVVGQVLRGAAWTVGPGLAGGLLLSSWAARRMESLLFQVSPRDPLVFWLSAGALLLIAAIAAAVPAWRAASVDPRESLAAE